jgi:hypothetical protein
MCGCVLLREELRWEVFWNKDKRRENLRGRKTVIKWLRNLLNGEHVTF